MDSPTRCDQNLSVFHPNLPVDDVDIFDQVMGKFAYPEAASHTNIQGRINKFVAHALVNSKFDQRKYDATIRAAVDIHDNTKNKAILIGNLFLKQNVLTNLLILKK